MAPVTFPLYSFAPMQDDFAHVFPIQTEVKIFQTVFWKHYWSSMVSLVGVGKMKGKEEKQTCNMWPPIYS